MIRLQHVHIKLVKDSEIDTSINIRSPEDAVACIRDFVSEFDREMFIVISLKTDGTPINFNICSVGSVSNTFVSVKDVAKVAILSNASQIIVMHNHLGKNVLPSKEDKMATAKLLKGFEFVGIAVLDHIIVSGSTPNIYSFLRNDILKSTDELSYEDVLDNYKVIYENIIRDYIETGIKVPDEEAVIVPVSAHKAFELWNQDIPVLLVYEDNSEAYAESLTDIRMHDGRFAIEKEYLSKAILQQKDNDDYMER